MTQGNKNGIKDIYLNVIRASSTLDPEFQRRVYHVAQLTKDEEIAAALAKRADTLPEIDEDLSTWSSAKVQSAWFTRPGRDIAAVVARLAREKRITVLEVLSALPDLPLEVYDICARRDATRVAMPLLSNTSASPEQRCAAARTLAQGFPKLSYARKGAMSGILSACDQDVIDAFVCASPNLPTASRALSVATSVSPEAVERVYELALDNLKNVCKLHKQACAETEASQGRRSWSNTGYELSSKMRELEEVFRQAPLMASRTNTDRTALFAQIEKVLAALAPKTLGRQDEEETRRVEMLKELLNLHGASEVATGPAMAIRQAVSTAELESVIDELVTSSKMDRSCAVAALTHPKANVSIAQKALRAFGWGEVGKFLEARHRDINLAAKGVIFASLFRPSDGLFERFSAPDNPTDVWMEVVSHHSKGSHGIPSDLFHSKFAKMDIVPKLPLRVFAQPDIPGWLITSFAEYLAAELTTQAAWDGFEVLAPKHLGPVSQVVRAAKVTGRASTEVLEEQSQDS